MKTKKPGTAVIGPLVSAMSVITGFAPGMIIGSVICIVGLGIIAWDVYTREKK